MTKLAVRFLALLGPISAYAVFTRLLEGEPPSVWVPLLITSLVINLITVWVVWRSRKADPEAKADEEIDYRIDDE